MPLKSFYPMEGGLVGSTLPRDQSPAFYREGKEPATRSDRHCDAEGSRGVPRPTSRRRGVARTRERSLPGAEGSQAAAGNNR